MAGSWGGYVQNTYWWDLMEGTVQQDVPMIKVKEVSVQWLWNSSGLSVVSLQRCVDFLSLCRFLRFYIQSINQYGFMTTLLLFEGLSIAAFLCWLPFMWKCKSMCVRVCACVWRAHQFAHCACGQDTWMYVCIHNDIRKGNSNLHYSSWCAVSSLLGCLCFLSVSLDGGVVLLSPLETNCPFSTYFIFIHCTHLPLEALKLLCLLYFREHLYNKNIFCVCIRSMWFLFFPHYGIKIKLGYQLIFLFWLPMRMTQ